MRTILIGALLTFHLLAVCQTSVLIPMTDKLKIGEINVFKSGVALTVFDNYQTAGFNPKRNYILFDSNLKAIDTITVNPSFRDKYSASFYSDSLFAQFFYDYRYGNFTLYCINSDFSIDSFGGMLSKHIYEPKIWINQHKMFLLNHMPNHEELTVYDLKKSTFRTFDVSAKTRRTTFDYVCLTTLQHSNDVLFVWQEKGKKHHYTYAYRFETETESMMKHKITFPYRTIQAGVVETDDGDLLFVGTYSKYFNQNALGVFAGLVQDGSAIRYSAMPFTKLTNYYNYLNNTERESLKRKIDKAETRETELDIPEKCMVTSVKKNGDRVSLSLEGYEPITSSPTGTIIRNGQTVAGLPKSTDGYFFSHASIVQFDMFTEFKGDYFVSLESGELISALSPRLNPFLCSDTASYLYQFGFDVRTATILPGRIKIDIDTSTNTNTNELYYTSRNAVPNGCGSIISYGYKSGKGVLPNLRRYFYIEKAKLH
ncbi:MAG: hypothetical protein H6607_09000 [Flavobacteriales bacterium]|nr:hypothetical protein [Flavobacteriales bacterium]